MTFFILLLPVILSQSLSFYWHVQLNMIKTNVLSEQPKESIIVSIVSKSVRETNLQYCGRNEQVTVSKISSFITYDIYQCLMSSKDCLDKCSKDCFSLLDTTNITWLKPILNKKKAISIHHITFLLIHFLLFFFFFLSLDLFDFTVCVVYLIATFNCFDN